jgi:hypothetical protein
MNFEKIEKKKEQLNHKYKKKYTILEKKVSELSKFKIKNNKSLKRKKIGEFM